MSDNKGKLLDLVEMLRTKAPEYLDLLSAQTEEAFNSALDVLIERAVIHLEKNKSLYKTLNEEGLSAVLAGNLTTFGVVVIQESHSNGHVDITIEVEHCVPTRRLLGEAKIYNGPVYHLKGLIQLLDRYTTGREGRGLLIEYFRKPNISDLVLKIRKKMDVDLPCNQQSSTSDHKLKWSFSSTHRHSCGDVLEVSHIGCNLYVD